MGNYVIIIALNEWPKLLGDMLWHVADAYYMHVCTCTCMYVLTSHNEVDEAGVLGKVQLGSGP